MKLRLLKSWFARNIPTEEEEGECTVGVGPGSKWERQNELAAAIKKDINNIGCIYRSIGNAMYDEPRDRLSQMIARKIVDGEYHG